MPLLLRMFDGFRIGIAEVGKLKVDCFKPFVIKKEINMDFSKIEALEIEKTVSDAEVAVRELGELELMLAGGGFGDAALG